MTAEPLIGPLTPAEWVSFALGDDDRNPLPPCCGNISEVRDAIFDVLRAGGDPNICGRHLASVWGAVTEHMQVDMDGPQVPPALRKLYETYVKPNAEFIDRDHAEGLAQIMQKDPGTVRTLLAEVPKLWDLDTVEGRMRALVRVGGVFVAYVLDPGERSRLVRELAQTVGMTYEDVAPVVDALRLSHGLPWEPAGGVRAP